MKTIGLFYIILVTLALSVNSDKSDSVKSTSTDRPVIRKTPRYVTRSAGDSNDKEEALSFSNSNTNNEKPASLGKRAEIVSNYFILIYRPWYCV